MKRTFLIVMAILMLISCCEINFAIPVLAQANKASVQPGDKGLTFSDEYTYEAVKRVEVIPHTYEAWVNISSDANAVKGVILGNGRNVGKQKGYFALRVQTKNEKDYPAISWQCTAQYLSYEDEAVADRQYPNADIVLEKSEIKNDTWVHVALVFSEQWDTLSCYLDGKLTEQVAVENPIRLRSISDLPFQIGQCRYDLSEAYFEGGALQDITVFADSRTAEEVKADMEQIDLEDKDLLFHYDIDSNDLGKDVKDESGNGYDLYCNKLWLTEAEMEQIRNEKGLNTDRAYSFAVIGDTQKMTLYNPEKLPVLYQWLADNVEKENIRYAIGVGDVTETNTKIEWDTAKEAITILDGELEYSLVRGNHDEKNMKGYLDEYFANHAPYTIQFEQYGGFYEEGSVNNTYRTLTVGKTDWLLINLDYGPDDKMLNWAGSVIEQYPNHKVIISTHAYMEYDGSTLDASDNVPVYAMAVENNGDEIWSKLASQYENVKLMICGHVSSDNVLAIQNKGIHGNTVTQLLVDFQVTDLAQGGLGMVTMLYFNEDGTEFEVECYSTVKERYFKKLNQYTVDMEASCEPYTAVWNGTLVSKPKGDGTKENPYQIVSAANLCWMAEQLYCNGSNYNVCAPAEAGKSKNIFKGQYFKQLNDIDLDGGKIPSIGYYYKDSGIYSVFSGNYDGGGFAIRNGDIINRTASSDGTGAFGGGLFGVVTGATIQNLKLDGITVRGKDAVGALVGAIYPNVEGTATLIESCEVTATCKTVLYGASQSVETASVSGIVGAIFGAEGAEGGVAIRNCTNSAEVSLENTPEKTVYAGGVVGWIADLKAKQAVSILECKNSGSVAEQNAQDAKVLRGSIVGMITNVKDMTEETGSSVTLEKCVNETSLPLYCVVAMDYDALPLVLSDHKWNEEQTDVRSCSDCDEKVQVLMRDVKEKPVVDTWMIIGGAAVICVLGGLCLYWFVIRKKKK